MSKDSPVSALMREMGIELTREAYLNISFMGEPPEEPLDPELECELPRQFQRAGYRDDYAEGQDEGGIQFYEDAL